jgi:hypothetical protein
MTYGMNAIQNSVNERQAAQAVMASLKPETQAAHHAAWKRCEEYVLSLRRKGAKVFEVHHSIEHARRKYMALLAAYHAPDHCEREVRAMYCGAVAEKES